MRNRVVLLAVLFAGSTGTGARAQQGINLDAPPKPKGYVTFAAEPQVVPAGKRTLLDLRFHVNEGFHVNSHQPKSELLIPTRLDLQPAAGVRPGPVEYPAGTEYSFSFSPGEKLDIYAGAFTLRLPVVSEAGEHTVSGILHYQACDRAACYPPKALPVQVIFTAR